MKSHTKTGSMRNKRVPVVLPSYILMSFISLLTSLQTHANAEPVSGHKASKLLVCIHVDQLRTDRLLAFAPIYGTDGLHRLLSRGIVYPLLDFGYRKPDAATALASIHTGSYPWRHGIYSTRVYDLDKRRDRPIELDNDYIGNYTSERVSPRVLQVGTLGDELKAASAGRSTVYSIAPNAAEALFSAGSLADGVYWIDNSRAQWATTTFYTKPLPWYIDQYNRGVQSLSKRIATMQWSPLTPSRNDLIPYGGSSSFSYKMLGATSRFKRSGLVNEEVTNLALLFVQHGGYEYSTVPHLLNITYYAGAYTFSSASSDAVCGAEMQDTYRRLDAELARLFTALDKKLGSDGYNVMLSGTGYSEDPCKLTSTNDLPKKVFSAARAKALLNLFLMAMYGQADWVIDCNDSYVYLNRKAIEEAKLSLTEVSKKSAEFLSEMAGVQQALPTATLHPYTANPETLSIAKGYSSSINADILIDFVPGWTVEDSTRDSRQVKPQRYDATSSPLIFFGSEFKHKIIQDEIPTVDRIAPTLAFILRIRPPNAAAALPLNAVIIPADIK